jgi:microcin C transport system substrate-binding protein
MKLNRRSMALLLASTLLARLRPSRAAEAAKSVPAPAPAPSGVVTLPKDVVWETNNDEPIIGSEKAIRGGRLRLGIWSYPLTFRLRGPNTNDSFAAWNTAFTSAFALVGMHPVTDKSIPIMATHWSVQKDQKTIYYKLDQDARWSDGKPVTAGDYVFAAKMLRSEFIVDPFANQYMKEYIVSVDRIDDYTLRIVGTRPSWRPLYDYNFSAMPEHATQLDKDWITRTNNQFPLAIGPYVISSVERGLSVTYKRLPNWWGDKKRYFLGQFNPDEIYLQVIPLERTLDYLRSGEIDMMDEISVKNWHEVYNFPAVNNGWVRRARVFTDTPTGIGGYHMNLEAPIFQNQDFRLAMQHLFNFDRLNRNLWYGDYYRPTSFFQGTEFANPAVKNYPFDPEKAREHLARAGYRRPASVSAQGTLAKMRNIAYGLLFTRSDTDDILVNDRGERASFTCIYFQNSLSREMTVTQQEFRRAGIDMRLQLLEPGAGFERGLERKFEMIFCAWGASFYPDPRQYLHTDIKKTKNNNDFWGYGTPQVDALIETYEKNLDPQARKQAMYKIDEIVHGEGFYIPFRTAPYLRVVYWDYIQWPEFFMPKRGGDQNFTDWMVYWIDPDKKAKLADDMKAGKTYPLDPNIDKDFYNVRQKFQQT